MSFCAELFERLRFERQVTWGRPLRTLGTTSSTNDLALDAADSDAKTGIVWVAEEQTAGRGRRGQIWQAAPGTALLASTLLRYPGGTERLAGLSLIVGLAVRDALLPLLPASAAAYIKWPNDVYVGDQKLAGILAETRLRKGTVSVVIGIGLNTETETFPPGLFHATSLALLGVPPAQRSRESLLVNILAALERRLPRFFSLGLHPFCDELGQVDYLKGRRGGGGGKGRHAFGYFKSHAKD